MNYWEQKNSFWSKPAGLVVQILIILLLIGGAILALNIFTSPYPVLESFNASPVVISPGEESTLSWTVIGATIVRIDPGVGTVTPKGSVRVSPEETTTYVLTAVNGTINRSVSVKVMVR